MTGDNEFKEVVISYGQSDEYGFVFRRDAQAYNRRARYVMSELKEVVIGYMYCLLIFVFFKKMGLFLLYCGWRLFS